LTLGLDRADTRTPPDTSHVWGSQINQVKNLLLLMSATFKGGTRLGVATQSSNPFGASESGFYIDTSGVAWSVFNGTRTSLGSATLGNYTASGNNLDISVAGTMALGTGNSNTTSMTFGSSATGPILLNGTRLRMQQAVQSGVTAISALSIIGGAHTNMTASTEYLAENHQLNQTYQWATGALATQRFSLFQAPTISFVGASNVTGNTATLVVSGAPAMGTNATLTGNAWALWLQAGNLGMGANTTIGQSAQSATNTTALTLNPNVADGASSIALKLNNTATPSTAGFKDLSVQQGGVEQWFVGYPGATTIPELRGTGANIGMRNSSNTGIVVQGANDVNVYGAGSVNWHFLANNYLEPSGDNAYTFGNNTNRVKASYMYWRDYKLGAQLTAASTITPTCALHHVTGATTINLIALTNVPSTSNVSITLIADSTITFGSSASAGGIKVAPGTTLTSGKCMTFVLDQATSLWYPQQGA